MSTYIMYSEPQGSKQSCAAARKTKEMFLLRSCFSAATGALSGVGLTSRVQWEDARRRSAETPFCFASVICLV